MLWGLFTIDKKLDLILERQKKMGDTLDTVKTLEDQMGDALTAIAQTVDTLKANANDPAKVQAIADEIKDHLAKAAAIK